MTPKSRGLVDIGIGRLPVRTSEEAKAVVDKIISYMTDCKLGIWKNSLCFLADDGNGSDGFSTVHVSDADILILIRNMLLEYPIRMSTKRFRES